MISDTEVEHCVLAPGLRDVLARDCFMKAAHSVLGVAPDADAGIVSAPDFNECVCVTAGEGPSIPEYRATIVSPISVHARDIVRGTEITLAERTLEPTKSFRVIAPYATSGAKANAKVYLAGRVTGNRAPAIPAESGACVGMDEN
jgi:hypothetical protein